MIQSVTGSKSERQNLKISPDVHQIIYVQIFTWIEDTWSNIVQICPGALFIRENGLNLWSKIYVNLIRSITDAPYN